MSASGCLSHPRALWAKSECYVSTGKPPFSQLIMDTIIRENPQTFCIEHAVLPTAAPKLTLYQRLVTKTILRFESFVERVICCVPNSIVEDWEFDTITRQCVAATQYDDVEFSELVDYFNHATEAEKLHEVGVNVGDRGESPTFDTHDAAVGWAKTLLDDALSRYSPTQCEDGSIDEFDDEADRAIERDRRLGRGVRTRRRRKRVVAYVVVALINKVRCKYYHMDDSVANRRLVGSYLLKLMREHNFRTSDIHLHVDYAVSLYFELSGSKMKPTVYARQ